MKDLGHDFGSPDLKLQGFQLWVHGWESPDVARGAYEDWLRVSVHCGGHGASVWVEGSILMASSVDRWVKACETLHNTLTGDAVLDPVEPYFSVRLVAHGPTGKITARVDISPDPGTQEHVFTFEIDQSYLPLMIAQCRALLQKYPAPAVERDGA